MAHPLSEIQGFDYNALNKELTLTKEEKDAYLAYWRAYCDDFWQKGDGSLLPPARGAHASVLDGLFHKRFVYRNIIKEMAARVSGAFFSKNPNWRFSVDGVPVLEENDENKTELEDVDKALNEFWSRQDVATVLAKAFESRLVFGRGGVRIYVPAKFKRKPAPAAGNAPAVEGNASQLDEETAPLEEGAFEPFETIQDAIAAIRVEFIGPEHSKLLDDGGEFFSVVKYAFREDWTTNQTQNLVEFSFVDDVNQTFIGNIPERSGISKLEDANLSSPFDLDGLPTFNEFKGTPYITGAMYKNNQLANLALTCSGFALVDNGFKELITTNVDVETRTEEGPDGTTIHVPVGLKRGGGAVQNLVGIQDVDDTTGKATRTTPTINYSDPVPMNSFKDGYDLAYRACLSEARQLFALISGDAAASGESRVQAVSDFISTIGKYKSETDRMGGWLMTVVLRWAAALAGVAEQFSKTVLIYDTRIYVTALSPDERTAVMTMREKGTISRETERVLLGIDDPDLETELITDELEQSPSEISVDDFSERLDVALKMSAVGIDNQSIQKYLGFTDAEIGEMKQRQADEAAAFAETIRVQTEAQTKGQQGGVPGGQPGQTGAAGAGA